MKTIINKPKLHPSRGHELKFAVYRALNELPGVYERLPAAADHARAPAGVLDVEPTCGAARVPPVLGQAQELKILEALFFCRQSIVCVAGQVGVSCLAGGAQPGAARGAMELLRLA
jgi:hypothetical protein